MKKKTLNPEFNEVWPGAAGLHESCGASLGWVGVWRDLSSKGSCGNWDSVREGGQQLPEEPSAMVGRLYQTAQQWGPSKRLTLMQMGVKRENVEQLLSDLLDDRVGKGDVNRMRRHPG